MKMSKTIYSKKTSRKSEVSHGTHLSQEETKVTERIDPWLRKHSEDSKKRHPAQRSDQCVRRERRFRT